MTGIISFAAFCSTFSTSPAMICFLQILNFFSQVRPLGSQISSHQASQHTFGLNNYFWPKCQAGMPVFLILKFPLRLSKSACWELVGVGGLTISQFRYLSLFEPTSTGWQGTSWLNLTSSWDSPTAHPWPRVCIPRIFMNNTERTTK